MPTKLKDTRRNSTLAHGTTNGSESIGLVLIVVIIDFVVCTSLASSRTHSPPVDICIVHTAKFE